MTPGLTRFATVVADVAMCPVWGADPHTFGGREDYDWQR
jgi:hypothetical protein